MAESPRAQGNMAEEGFLGGQIIGEFKDSRAAVLLVMGAMVGALGIALVAARLLANLKDDGVGLFAIVLGAGFLALGYWRKNNRLLVYPMGIVQVKNGKAEFHLWGDVQDVVVEQQRHYHNLGMYKTVRYACYLQRKDAAWVKVNAVPITVAVIQAIRQSCKTAGLGWQQKSHEAFSL